MWVSTESFRRRALLLSVAALGACTLINDPASHMGQLRDAPDRPDAPPAEMIPLDDFCDELAQLFCDAMRDCCTLETPPSDCVARTTADCDTEYGRTLLRDARAGYDPVIAAQFVADGRRLVSDGCMDFLPWTRRLLATVLDGIRPTGADCTPEPMDAGFDYAALLSCDGPDNACVYITADRWACLARVGVGESCSLNNDCIDGLFCDAPPMSARGRCATRRTAGSPCSLDLDQCEGFCFCRGATCAMTGMGTCANPTAEQIYCYLLVPTM